MLIGVSLLMLLPRPPPSLDTGWDKANHLLAFAGPTVAGMAALRRRDGWRAPALCLALLAWGGALELLQGLLPPRTADWADWAADGAGIFLGLAVCALAARLSRRA
jgi:VanZ family protein